MTFDTIKLMEMFRELDEEFGVEVFISDHPNQDAHYLSGPLGTEQLRYLEALAGRLNEAIKPKKKITEDLFDFGAIYKIYPRKAGKKKGLELCRAKIKTAQDYERLKIATVNYAREVKGAEITFIKHFSTFMNCWEDFVEVSKPEEPEIIDPATWGKS